MRTWSLERKEELGTDLWLCYGAVDEKYLISYVRHFNAPSGKMNQVAWVDPNQDQDTDHWKDQDVGSVNVSTNRVIDR